MEEHLYTLLSGAVSFPVGPVAMGKGTTTPRAVYSKVGGTQDYIMAGRGPRMTRLQVDVYGATYSEATLAARQVESVLDGYAGGPIDRITIAVPAQDRTADDAELLYHVMTIFAVHHRV